MTGDPAQDIARAGAALELRRPAEARALLEAVLARSPGDAEALVLLARACSAEKDIPRVHQLTRSAAAAAPDDVGILVACADVARDSYDLEAAYFWASRALEIAPDSTAALNVMSLVQIQRGQGAEAVVYAQEALRHSPLDPDLLVAQGLALDTAGQLGDATACYVRALELDPDHVPALNNLATVRLQCGDLRRATRLLSGALVLDPRMEVSRGNVDVLGVLARRVLLSTLGLGTVAAAGLAFLRVPGSWALLLAAAVWTVVGVSRLPAVVRGRLGAIIGWPDVFIGGLIVLATPLALGFVAGPKMPVQVYGWIAIFALTFMGRLGWDRLRVARRLRELGVRLPQS